MRLVMSIDQKFQDLELYTIVQKMQKQKFNTPEKLVSWIFSVTTNVMDQIIAIYVWISQSFTKKLN